MSAVPMQETARQAVSRLFAEELRQGYRLTGCHRYNAADGAELFRVVRLKHAELEKVIIPIYRDGFRYRKGRGPKPDAGWPLYVPPYPLVEAGPVFVVEGEACADALAKLGKVATTSGGATSDSGADWVPLEGRSVILWPDHDKPGADYAARVADRLRALGCDVRRIDVEALHLPEGGDVVDWIAANPDGDVDALPMVATADATKPEGFAPEPLPSPLPDVPAFDESLLPECVRPWCADIAQRASVPLDFVAVPAMVMLGAALGRCIAVSMLEHGGWYERAILWGCVIGRPSSGKSPALAPARRLLDKLALQERAAYEREVQEHMARAMVAEAHKGNAREAIKAAIKKGDTGKAEALARDVRELEGPPPEPRLTTNDATVPKVGELLNANPRGLLLYRDELAGWLAGLDREGCEGDRAFWLECWNGSGGFTVDRIGRGTIRVEACAVSILGGMQPGKLATYVRGAVNGGFNDDGLIQRFQLAVYPNQPRDWRLSDKPGKPESEAAAWEAMQRLRNLNPEAVGARQAHDCDVPYLPFDAEARELLKEWMEALMQRLRSDAEPEWMESHLSKYRSLAGRLALLLHLADGHGGPIPADTLARALDWCTYLEAHARRIYAPAMDGGVTAAHALLAKRNELPGPFTLRDVYRKGWAGLGRDEVSEAAEVLAEYGHLRAESIDTGGRPSVQFWWAGS
ncbi:hypothetical protein MASR1M8_11470 [Thermomonas brevis]